MTRTPRRDPARTNNPPVSTDADPDIDDTSAEVTTADETHEVEAGCDEVRVRWETLTRSKKVRLSVYRGDQLVHRDNADVHDERERCRFTRDVLVKCSSITPEYMHDALLQASERVTAEREAQVQGQIEAAAAGGAHAQYRAVPSRGGPGAAGLYRLGDPDCHLCNACIRIERDVTVDDEVRPDRRFEGSIELLGHVSPFSISASDFSSNEKLRAALFQAAGSQLQIHADIPQVRTAISAVSQPRSSKVTTSVGWSGDSDVYRFPGGVITANGYREITDDDEETRVDLTGWGYSRYLELQAPYHIPALRHHVVNDLLRLHDPRVMRCLLAAVALAVLQRFSGVAGKPAIWLKGLTGTGKSFVAQVVANFFGNFGVGEGRVMTWASTPNAIEKEGHAFRDSLYLVDDYKPEVISPWAVVRVLQAYADGTARGRLNADASTKATWPIRGLLISTGEDLPEQTPSAIARSIVVTVPQCEKDLALGRYCVEMANLYPAFTAGFITYLIRHERFQHFADHVAEFQEVFCRDIAGQQNDARIATNLAMLGAAFYEIARYLSPAWSGWKAVVRQFLHEDLLAIRGDMLQETRSQQPSEVFCKTLWTLVQYGQVRITSMPTSATGVAGAEADGKALVGRWCSSPASADRDALEINLSMALGEVQQALQRQGKPKLMISERMLIQQLLEGGFLVDEDNRPIAPGTAGPRTRQVRFDGERVRMIRLSIARLRQDRASTCGGEPSEAA
jgi:hypothetical protein